MSDNLDFWKIGIFVAGLFCASAWITKNPEYVTIANTAMIMAVTSALSDIVAFVIKTNRETK